MGENANGPNTVTEIRVGFRKTVSDRQYGNETAEITLTAAISGQQESAAVAAALAVEARALVTEQLRGSPSESVQRALETANERKAREAAERARWDQEREAARQQRFADAVEVDGDEDEDDDERDASPF